MTFMKSMYLLLLSKSFAIGELGVICTWFCASVLNAENCVEILKAAKTASPFTKMRDCTKNSPAMNLLLLSKSFTIEELGVMCTWFLASVLNTENCMEILKASKTANNKRLQGRKTRLTLSHGNVDGIERFADIPFPLLTQNTA